MAEETYRHIVRIANTDVQGNKRIFHALTKIKGVSFMFANMACSIAKIDKQKKAGSLTDEEVKKLDRVIVNPEQFNAPSWLFNRRRDTATGYDAHVITGNLGFITDNDIKMLKKIRAYKGARHAAGLPVRGQRTRSNFRRNKGKVMGVQRKRIAAPKPEKGKEK